MRTGRLRDPAEIQSRTSGKDAYGGRLDTWAKLADVWAEIKSVGSKDVVVGHLERGTTDTEITIRRVAGVNTSCRVVAGVRTFEIVAPPIDKNQRGAEMLLLCKEVFDV